MSWFLSDRFVLQELLNGLVHFHGEIWYCALYSNDYDPEPDTTTDDMDECDFPGYEQVQIIPDFWPDPTVTDHVASSTYPDDLVFTAESSGFSSQMAFGYFVLDGDSNLIIAERFDTPFTVTPGGVVKVKPRLRNKTCYD